MMVEGWNAQAATFVRLQKTNPLKIRMTTSLIDSMVVVRQKQTSLLAIW
jgi:hypothetical protein